jgi:hypothetical protein
MPQTHISSREASQTHNYHPARLRQHIIDFVGVDSTLALFLVLSPVLCHHYPAASEIARNPNGNDSPRCDRHLHDRRSPSCYRPTPTPRRSGPITLHRPLCRLPRSRNAEVDGNGARSAAKPHCSDRLDHLCIRHLSHRIAACLPACLPIYRASGLVTYLMEGRPHGRRFVRAGSTDDHRAWPLAGHGWKT